MVGIVFKLVKSSFNKLVKSSFNKKMVVYLRCAAMGNKLCLYTWLLGKKYICEVTESVLTSVTVH